MVTNVSYSSELILPSSPDSFITQNAMPSNSDVTSSRARTTIPGAVFKSWPVYDQPLRSWIIFSCLVGVGVIAGRMTGQAITGLIVLLLLLIASWQLWLPMSWELGPKGVIRGVLRWRQRVAWSEFSGYEVKTNGVLLLHHTNHSPVRAVNGLFLPSSPPHTELLSILDHYLKARPGDPIISTQTLVP